MKLWISLSIAWVMIILRIQKARDLLRKTTQNLLEMFVIDTVDYQKRNFSWIRFVIICSDWLFHICVAI